MLCSQEPPGGEPASNEHAARKDAEQIARKEQAHISAAGRDKAAAMITLDYKYVYIYLCEYYVRIKFMHNTIYKSAGKGVQLLGGHLLVNIKRLCAEQSYHCALMDEHSSS